MTYNLKQTIIIVTFYVLICLLSFRNLLTTPGVIGLRNDWSIPPYQEQLDQLVNERFYVWSSESTGYMLNPTFKQYFLLGLYELFYLFGLGGDVLSKFLGIFTMLLSGLSMYFFSRTIKMKSIPALIAGTFYMLSPVYFTRFVLGHIEILISYAFFPLLFATFIRSFENQKINYRMLILASLIFSVAVVEEHYVIFVLVLLFAYSIFTRNLAELTRRFKVFSILFVLFFVAHLYEFSALLFVKDYVQTIIQQNVRSVESWIAQSPQLIQALRLIGGLIGVAKAFDMTIKHYGVIPENFWIPISYLIPILVFTSIIFKPRDKNIIFLTLVALISVFLCKGVNAPLGELFVFFIYNAPIISLFRQLYHFSSIVAFAYAPLIGTTCGVILDFLNQRSISGITLFSDSTRSALEKFVRMKLPTTKHIAVVIMFGILFLYSWPFFTGNFGDQVQQYNLKPEYRKLFNDFQQNKEDFKVILLPTMTPMQYDNSVYAGMDPLMGFSKPAFYYYNAPQEWAGGSARYLYFIVNSFVNEKTAYLGQLLSLANIKYVIYRDGVRSVLNLFLYHGRYPHFDESWTNENLLSILRGQKDLSEVEKLDGAISIYENDHFLPHLYADEEGVVVAGDLSTLVSLSYAAPVFNMSNLPVLFFTPQLSSEDNPINFSKTVIIQNDDYFDLMSSLIANQYKLYPGNFAIHGDVENGWTPVSDWWWYNWDYSAALESSALTRTESSLSMPFSVSASGEYEIWAKTFFGNEGSSITFSLDQTNLNTINTRTPSNRGFMWSCIGTSLLEKGQHALTVKSSEGENVVSRIIIAPSNIITETMQNVEKLLLDKNVILIYELENFADGATTWSSNVGMESSRGLALQFVNQSNPFELSTYIPKEGEYELYIRASGITLYSNQIDASTATLLYGNKTVGQTFVPTLDRIRGIDVLMRRNALPENLGPVSLTLWNEPSKIAKIASVILQPSEILGYSSTNDYNWIFFPVTAQVNPRKEYYFELTTIGGNESSNYNIGFSLTAFKNRDPYTAGDMYENGVKHKSPRQSYDLAFRTYYESKSHITSTFENNTITIKSDAAKQNIPDIDPNFFGFRWISIGNFSLNKGNYPIVFSNSGNQYLDQLLMINRDKKDVSDTGSTSIKFEKINPTKYVAHVNSSQPFFLAFSESFAQSWIAYSGDEEFQHFKINSFTNGYYVNKTGTFNITLELPEQSFHERTLTISLTTIVLLATIEIFSSLTHARLRRKLIAQLTILRTRFKNQQKV